MTSKTDSDKTYIAIDLKSFYASVECVERKLDPLTTNLVVADASRTDKTICLAVSPSLKAYGISGRARLFEVVRRVKQVNRERQYAAPGHRLTGASVDDTQVRADPALAVDYLVAVPRMAYYIEYSTRIYRIYLRYIAPEDIHVYSIDEVFIDATSYLRTYHMTGHELAMQMIREVLKETGITATAGIGTNLYLSKIAMDIVAKHIPADEDGVRIAQLDEMGYRRQLWSHRPLTDFWRVGRGYARKLEAAGLFTMGDIARCSEENEELLYKLFGINAELLIDHAWGWEPCTIAAIKAYRPENRSFSSGQVLMCPYDFSKARVVAREMAEACALDLLEKKLVTDQVILTVGYDRESLTGNGASDFSYEGEVTVDYYGRPVPKHAHGTGNLPCHTSSSRLIEAAVMELFDQLVDPGLLVRRITIDVNHVITEQEAEEKNAEPSFEQLSFFVDPPYGRKGDAAGYAAGSVAGSASGDAAGYAAGNTLGREAGNTFGYEAGNAGMPLDNRLLDRERRANEAMLEIRRKYGRNAVLKGTNFEEGATGRERNQQIGGHKA